MKNVVIIGGGFGGLYCARALADAQVRVTLVDRRNHHLFQPLLYQVATAALNPADIAQPIRAIVRKQPNCEVLLAEVTAVDAPGKRVILDDGSALPFDYLVLATGATHSYFGHDEWLTVAPGLKTVEDALEIRKRILSAFEEAERMADDAKVQREWLTFVVVGGGPTGVELAGAISEVAFHSLTRDFRRIDPRQARVLLLEGTSHLLAAYPEVLRDKARKQLAQLGVQVHVDARVVGIDDHGVTVHFKSGEDRIAARTVLWGAGVAASPLAKTLGVPLDRAGRVLVTPTLNAPGWDNVFVIGDLAAVKQADGQLVPGVAPAAMQEGRYVAQAIVDLAHEKPIFGHPFAYLDKGSLATIGRKKAIADLPGHIRLSGFIAWLAWLFIHILFLIGFRNRILVIIEWAWQYLTFKRGVAAHHRTAGGRAPRGAHGRGQSRTSPPAIVNDFAVKLAARRWQCRRCMLTRGSLLVVLVLGGCSAEEPSWEEGEIGEVYEGLSVGGAGGCSTFVVDGLSKQLIAEQNCIQRQRARQLQRQEGHLDWEQRLPVPRAQGGSGAGGGRHGLGAERDVGLPNHRPAVPFVSLVSERNLRHLAGGGAGELEPRDRDRRRREQLQLRDRQHVESRLVAYLSVVGPGALRLHGRRDQRSAAGQRVGVPAAVEPEQPQRQDRRGRRVRADDGGENSGLAGDGLRQGLDLRAEDDAGAGAERHDVRGGAGRSVDAATLGAGEVQAAWVEFKNTGTATWEPGTTRLGTTDPQDRDSALSAPDWIAANRAATVDAETKPGETGRFTFSLRGPVVTEAEALTEHFGLVQEGVAWFPAAASLTVDVMVTPAAVPGGDPAESTEGGATPGPAAPGSAHGGCSVGAGGAARRRRGGWRWRRADAARRGGAGGADAGAAPVSGVTVGANVKTS